MSCSSPLLHDQGAHAASQGRRHMTGSNRSLSISDAANTGTQPPKEMRRDRAAMCDVGRRKDEICMARAVRERRMVRREQRAGESHWAVFANTEPASSGGTRKAPQTKGLGEPF